MSKSSREMVIAELRAHIARVAPVRRIPSRLPMGIPCLEQYVGGWPCPGMSLIQGRPGIGRMGLVLPIIRDLTSKGQWVPVVDGAGWLYPPGLNGVDLSKLIWVQAGARTVWASVQLARSGGFPLVVVLDPPRLGRGGRQLLHAAEQGRCSILILSEYREQSLPLNAHFVLKSEGVQIRRGARRPSNAWHRWRDTDAVDR